MAAREILRREYAASRHVASNFQDLENSDRYGFIPKDKPDDSWCLLFENWNSLGIFTGKKKVEHMDRLIKQYNVDTVTGCESQCD